MEHVVECSKMNDLEGWCGGEGGVADFVCSKILGAGLDKTLRIEFRSIGVFNSGG